MDYSNLLLSMYSDKSLSETFPPKISEQCFYHDRSLEISVRPKLKLHKHVILALPTVLAIALGKALGRQQM
jgi:hypothetical protein